MAAHRREGGGRYRSVFPGLPAQSVTAAGDVLQYLGVRGAIAVQELGAERNASPWAEVRRVGHFQEAESFRNEGYIKAVVIVN